MDSHGPFEQLLKALEARDLDTARALAEQLARAQGRQVQLAAEVLHELRQPLQGVKAYAQLFGEAGAGAAAAPVAQVLAQVERMEHIISDFTRLVADRPAPQEKVDLCRHVREAQRQFLAQADPARLSLEVDAPDGLELMGNGRLLEQLVLNLLSNAREALGGIGRVKVLVTREGECPALYVADWGPGVPAELKGRIFEPYVTAKGRGSGLGLSVCRRIAQEHGAVLTLADPAALRESSPPATLFKVLFPASAPGASPRKRVLVVDDELIIRMVFRDLLSKECELLDVGTAEEALEHLRRERFDLIVTDKNLPGLSGLDLAQKARQLDPASRVMIMTGYPSLVTAQQALELGVVDYLLKPFDEIREVREKIRAALASAPPTAVEPRGPCVDVYEDNPASARQLKDALDALGLTARLHTTADEPTGTAPAGVVVSWDFASARGREAVQLARRVCQGAPFIILAEHLTMETTLDCLRGGAAACLPKLLADVRALSRELSRALRLSP